MAARGEIRREDFDAELPEVVAIGWSDPGQRITLTGGNGSLDLAIAARLINVLFNLVSPALQSIYLKPFRSFSCILLQSNGRVFTFAGSDRWFDSTKVF